MRLPVNLLHLNTIILFFVFVALPLWALPLHDDPVVARDHDGFTPRDITPTPTYQVLQERQGGLILGALRGLLRFRPKP